jgi:hypothetical protein
MAVALSTNPRGGPRHVYERVAAVTDQSIGGAAKGCCGTVSGRTGRLRLLGERGRPSGRTADRPAALFFPAESCANRLIQDVLG